MNTPYQILGEAGIRELCARFYDIMDKAPEAATIRRMHAADLGPMKEKLADYLIGWMGGPPLYADKYGSVCMTEPHAPYRIGPVERDQWLWCMDRALEESGASEELKRMLEIPLQRIAAAVQNSEHGAREPDGTIIATG
ncbi:group II truncated hemoglobin [Parahaliea mediterranea]|uniref:Group II truncated hemoglobin n=1 Tax=Parahaliea mediterranea TaxID=651086 RepID=A0A939IM38_9GAMM|nr:group II truncated hemoglobin [Parahaliea mediterranea]MBN7796607.1 group II truncated hemoglobin [Parahaliea mediterranea]